MFAIALIAGLSLGQLPGFDEADELLLRGSYAEAAEMYAKLGKSDPARASLGQIRCLVAEGKYEEAAKLCDASIKAHPENAWLLVERGDLNMKVGKYAEAKADADAALKINSEHAAGRWLRAQALTAVGKFEESNADLKWAIDYYNEKQPTDAETLYYVASGSIEFALRNKKHDDLEFILNDMLGDAVKESPNYWPAKWLSGSLLLDKYNRSQGIPDLQAALTLNPSSVKVLVSLAESSLQDYDYPAGHALADQALSINPKSVDALVVKADLMLTDNRTEESLPFLNQALEINPQSESALGRMAAAKLLLKDNKAVDEIEKKVLAFNPNAGKYYTAVADHLGRRLQFDVAEKYYRKAIAAMPYLADPLNGLGIMLMRIGEEDEARKIFAMAREIDPYHVRVSNMVLVLKHMEDYKIIKSPHYDVYVSKDDELLGKYMSEYLETVHPVLVKRFAYEPKGRTKIEIMQNHQWFSGRVVGVPSVGTVGACTGRVVALASPTSLKNNRFNWARVLTHEVVHIITLEQTNFNIPHWYTEALAVLSEGFDRPQEWNVLLAERVPKDELLNLDNINHAFIRPKRPEDWQMAYCQALIYAQYMLERFGDDALAKLLDAYRQGMETNDAIPKTFNVTKEDFEKGYKDYIKKLAAGLGSFAIPKPPSYSEAQRFYRANPNNPDAAANLAALLFARRQPDRARELANKALELKENHAGALCVLARMEASIGRLDDAEKILRRGYDANKPDPQIVEQLAEYAVRRKQYDEAIKLYDAAQQRDPLRVSWVEGLILALLKEKESTGKSDEEKLKSALVKLCQMEADNSQARKRLSEIFAKNKDWPKAEKYARETLHIDVNDWPAHRILADALFAQNRFSEAAYEYELSASKSPGLKDGILKAAEAHKKAGKHPKARQLLRDYLKENPGDEKAKKLLESDNGDL